MVKIKPVSYTHLDVYKRQDLTGLNWSQVPAIYIEMGFLSHSREDQSLASSSFQQKCAQGIANGRCV